MRGEDARTRCEDGSSTCWFEMKTVGNGKK